MKTIGSWILAGLLAMPAFAAAQVNSLPSQPHLLVKGEASREVTPDRFTLSVKRRAVDPAPELARGRVRASAAAVLASFKRNHALPESVQASSLQIQPSYRYVQPAGREFKGTEVTRSLAATFRTLEDARRFLAGLKTSQEVELSGIAPTFSGAAALRTQLKREAAEQTRHSAAELAKAYGVQLGGLYTISDVAPSFAYGIKAGSWPETGDQMLRQAFSPSPPAPEAPAADVGAESLEAGSLTLAENIYAVFLIAQ